MGASSRMHDDELRGTDVGFALFETAIGWCGISWNHTGLTSLRLPEPAVDRLRTYMGRGWGPAAEREPPAPVVHAIAAVVALVDGKHVDLDGIELDFSEVPEFARRVYVCARTIRPGDTLTYGEVAERVGSTGAARAVGQALGRNPFAIIVPCHRVIAAGGRLGGFSAPGGTSTKRRLLAIEATASGALPFPPISR